MQRLQGRPRVSGHESGTVPLTFPTQPHQHSPCTLMLASSGRGGRTEGFRHLWVPSSGHRGFVLPPSSMAPAALTLGILLCPPSQPSLQNARLLWHVVAAIDMATPAGVAASGMEEFSVSLWWSSDPCACWVVLAPPGGEYLPTVL